MAPDQPGQSASSGQKTCQANDHASTSGQTVTVARTMPTNTMTGVTDDAVDDGAGGAVGLMHDDDVRLHKENCVSESQSTLLLSSSSSSGIILSVQIIINECLNYITFYRNCGNVAAMKKVVCNFVLPAEISTAKLILINQFQSILKDLQFASRRRDSSTRSLQEAEFDDITGACNIIDKAGRMQEVIFAAANLDRMPKCGPEDLNIYSIGEKQVVLSCQLEVVRNRIDQLESASAGTIFTESAAFNQDEFDKLANKIDKVSECVKSQLQHIETCISAQNMQHVQKAGVSDHDRASNVILFGVRESKNPQEWRSKVEDVLQFVAGHAVDMADMFRLGRYCDNKTRPILVKLRNI